MAVGAPSRRCPCRTLRELQRGGVSGLFPCRPHLGAALTAWPGFVVAPRSSLPCGKARGSLRRHGEEGEPCPHLRARKGDLQRKAGRRPADMDALVVVQGQGTPRGLWAPPEEGPPPRRDFGSSPSPLQATPAPTAGSRRAGCPSKRGLYPPLQPRPCPAPRRAVGSPRTVGALRGRWC